MDMIQWILSSVVIVAVINLMIQNKSNKLNFITGERAKWRECLKRIAVEIEKSDMDVINIPLAELKVSINSYGNYRNNPILKERMDIFKDEHIWEIIFLIEDECIKKNNSDRFDEYKEKLIDYIGFLLKFEWERSKYEVKLSKDLVGLEEMGKAKNIENKKVKNLVNGIKENEGYEYSFICDFIKHGNYIIRYKHGDDIYLTIGRDKKTWKKWFAK